LCSAVGSRWGVTLKRSNLPRAHSCAGCCDSDTCQPSKCALPRPWHDC
jgi:hypothetical protein